MSAIAIIAFLAGAVFGRSFRVLVLLPATLVGLGLVVGGSLATGAGGGQMAGASALVVLGLQFGYVAGIVMKHLFAASRAPRVRPGRTAAARSSS
jgi:hypothetical protein